MCVEPGSFYVLPSHFSLKGPATRRASSLVSRFRSSHHCAARSFANFGIEGHWQLIDPVWLWFRSPHFGLGPREGCGLLNRHTGAEGGANCGARSSERPAKISLETRRRPPV